MTDKNKEKKPATGQAQDYKKIRQDVLAELEAAKKSGPPLAKVISKEDKIKLQSADKDRSNQDSQSPEVKKESLVKSRFNFFAFFKKTSQDKKSDTKTQLVSPLAAESKEVLPSQDTDKSRLSKRKLVELSKLSQPDVIHWLKGAKVILTSFLIAIILFIIVLCAGVYFLSWQNQGIKKLSRYLPLPAGLYNWQPIWLVEYWSDLETLAHFYSYQVAQGNFKEVPPDSEVKDIVWDRLVNIKLVAGLAEEYGLTVSNEEVKTEVDKIVNETGNREVLNNNLYEYYRWDIETFSKKVIMPYLLEQKVASQVMTDAKYEEIIQAEAENIRQQLMENPDKFAELASEHSDDVASAARGGDLGYFNQGVMIPEFENVAFSLAVGEISDLVRTNFGYHIIMLTDKQVNKDDADDIQIKASHILIAPLSMGEVLEQEKLKVRVIKFIDREVTE